MEMIDINNYLILNEKLAFINGYLNSIAILNTIPNNVMEHWLIDLGVIEEDLDTTFKKGMQAPNWTFKATEISNWQKVINATIFSQRCCMKYKGLKLIMRVKEDNLILWKNIILNAN